MEQELSDFEQIDISMEQAKEKIAMSDALSRLEKNADFKKVFTEAYLKTYALELVFNKAGAALQSDKNQDYIDGQLKSIGSMLHYMQFIHQVGSLAIDSLAADKAEQDQIYKERVN